MAERDIIVMNREELRRLHVLRKTLERNLTQIKAALKA